MENGWVAVGDVSLGGKRINRSIRHHILFEHLSRDRKRKEFIANKISKLQAIDFNIACAVANLI
jgi:hypothetical protein